MRNSAHDAELPWRVWLRLGMIAILALAAIAYFLVLLAARGSTAPAPIIVLLFLLLLTILLPFLLERRIDPFAPVVFYMLLASQWVGKPLLELLQGSYTNSQLPELSESEAYNLLFCALGIVVLGQVCYLLGYYSPAHRLFPAPAFGLPASLSVRRLKLAAGFLLALSAWSYIRVVFQVGGWEAMWNQIGQRRETYGDLGYYMRALDFCPVLFLMLASLPSIARRRFPRWLVPAVIGTTLLLAATGDRTRTLMPIISLLVLLHYLYRRLSLPKVVLIGIVLITLALAIQNLRKTTYSGAGVDFTVLQESGHSVPEQVEAFFLRRRGIDLLGVLVEIMPERLPFQYGQTYLNALLLPVPRSLWPDKPIIDESGIVGQALMGSKYYGLPVGTEGVLYMNFHLFGVVLGMLFFGIFQRLAYRALCSHPGHQGVAIVYAMVFYYIMAFTGIVLVKTALFAIATWILLKLIGPEKQTAS